MTMRRLIAIAAQHRGLASIPVASSAFGVIGLAQGCFRLRSGGKKH
jgi:hypothetical protein